ncbi:MAG: hypothetical protein R3E79_25615 [Caldilineaceae bacterium]
MLKQMEPDGSETRFGMLEMIREYGLTQLEASGELETIRRCHAQFFLALTEAIEPDLVESPPLNTRAHARLRAELDNLRAVFAWSQTSSSHDVQQRAEVGLRLTKALSWFPFNGDHTRELRRWMETILQQELFPPLLRSLQPGGVLAV